MVSGGPRVSNKEGGVLAEDIGKGGVRKSPHWEITRRSHEGMFGQYRGDHVQRRGTGVA